MQVLEHFHLKVIIPIKIFGIDISITNLVLAMFGAAILSFTLFFFLAVRPRKVPTKRQVIAEFLVDFVKRDMVYKMVGSKEEGDRWWPLIAGVFIFIFSNNLIGIIPGVYTPTANPIVPLTMAVMVFLTVQISNFTKNGIKGYIRTFTPSIVPPWMYIIVTPIEIISTIAKPFSLFVRLFANMLAGHTIIYVVLGLIIYFKSYFIAAASVPFAVIMTIFEILVSGVQAYIFAVLSALYIGEAVSFKH